MTDIKTFEQIKTRRKIIVERLEGFADNYGTATDDNQRHRTDEGAKSFINYPHNTPAECEQFQAMYDEMKRQASERDATA